MKRLLAIPLILFATLSFAAKQSVTTVPEGPLKGDVRTAVNSNLSKLDANDTELYGWVDQGVKTTSNPSFLSVNASGGNLAAANIQVTKAWFQAMPYTAGRTAVIHGEILYICKVTHTSSIAGATGNEPGVGDTWTTNWKVWGAAPLATVRTTAGGGSTTAPSSEAAVGDELSAKLDTANVETITGVTSTELGYLSGATGNIQTQINNISTAAPTVQSADPTSSSEVGWYLATGSGDLFYKSSAGLFTITGSYAADSVTYSLSLTVVGDSAVTVSGTSRNAAGSPYTISGLSGATALTGAYGGSDDTIAWSGTDGGSVTGSYPNYSINVDGNKTLTMTGSVAGGDSFVGAPGTAEGFETPGLSLAEFSETDSESVISFSDTAEKTGTYGALFANGSTNPASNYLKATLPSGEASFTLSWWYYVGASTSIYNNYPMFRMGSTNSPVGDSQTDTAYAIWDNSIPNPKISFYSYMGGGTTFLDSSIDLAYSAWYKFTLKRTNNTVDGLILEIRNAADTLLDTLIVDATDELTQYIYWFDLQAGNDTFLDDIQYDSTNP